STANITLVKMRQNKVFKSLF
ncbi:hypothetical protein D046_6853B, partial [Vibrio parahaemolyticus V-223/04]